MTSTVLSALQRLTLNQIKQVSVLCKQAVTCVKWEIVPLKL